MRVRYSWIIVALHMTVAGCAKADHARTEHRDVKRPNNIPSQHFQSHLKGAEMFWQFIERGDNLRQSGDYKAALDVYSTALNTHAFMRPEQAVALDQIALTYEAMGDLKNAADNYELASEVTMSDSRKKSFKAKADTLRQKLAAQPSA